MTAHGEAVPPLRWGIIGTGGIATQFVADLSLLQTATVSAVGSRTAKSAAAFADRFDIAHRHASYADLAADDSVDAVYVSTPHPRHLDAASLAITAGKAVLVEKSFTANGAQARTLIDAARRQRVFAMEAMWTRFLPHIVGLREIIDSGRLGEIRTLTADHGQWFPRNAENRLFSPELGGGALLDLGVYPSSFASMVLGTPDRIATLSESAFTGVDAQISILPAHPGGARAVISTTLEALSPMRAAVVGTDARVEIDPVWYAPSALAVIDRGGAQQRIEFPHEGHGLRHEAAEVARCVADHRLESGTMPLSETLSIMDTMDTIRAQGGFVLPADIQTGARPSTGADER